MIYVSLTMKRKAVPSDLARLQGRFYEKPTSLPVLTHPSTFPTTPLPIILNRINLVLGSKTCSFVALSLLSFVTLLSAPPFLVAVAETLCRVGNGERLTAVENFEERVRSWSSSFDGWVLVPDEEEVGFVVESEGAVGFFWVRFEGGRRVGARRLRSFVLGVVVEVDEDGCCCWVTVRCCLIRLYLFVRSDHENYGSDVSRG